MAWTGFSYDSGLAALSRGLDNVGKGLAGAEKQQGLTKLGEQFASGDTAGAVQSAIALGDLGTALKLSDLAQDKSTWAVVADRMAAGLGGAGAAPAPAPLGSLGSLGNQPPAMGPLGSGTSPDPEANNIPARPRAPAMSGGGANMRMPADPEIETRFVSTLREGGLTNPHGLAAFAAYGNAESGYSPANVNRSWSDPSQSGQPGTSGGLLSWRGPRLEAMKTATAGASDPVAAQAKFALTENPALTVALQNAKSPEEANALLAKAWRFAGYDQTEGGEYARRLAMTRAYVGKVGGGAPEATRTASAGPTPSALPPAITGTGELAMTLPPEALPAATPSARTASGAPAVLQIDQGVRFSLKAGAQANPNSPATQYTGAAVVESNRELFINPETGQPRTVAEAAAMLDGGTSAAAVPPTRLASAAPIAPTDAGMADAPAPGAREAQFVVPGSLQPVGGAPPAPGARQPGNAAAAAPAPVGPRNQVDPVMVKALVQNPRTREMGMKLWQQSQTGKDYGFQLVGDQLYRTDAHNGTAVPVPGATKQVQWSHFAGKDGSDYAFNPQDPSKVIKIVDGKADFVDVTDPAERSRIGLGAYKGPIQRAPDNEIKLPGKPATEVNVDQKAETAFDTTANTGIAKRFEDMSREGDTARTDLALVGQLRDLGQQIETGAKAAAQARLADWGIKVGKNVDKIEAYGALIDKLTPSQRVPGSGSTSDFEGRMFKNSLSRLINTPEGNAIIENTMAALAQNKLDRAVVAEKGLTKELSPAETIRQLRELPSPYESFKSFAKNGFKAGGDMPARQTGGVGTAAPAASAAVPGPAAPPPPPPPGTPAPAASLSSSDAAQSLANARAALAAGKPRGAVLKRLQDAGIDASGL